MYELTASEMTDVSGGVFSDGVMDYTTLAVAAMVGGGAALAAYSFMSAINFIDSQGADPSFGGGAWGA